MALSIDEKAVGDGVELSPFFVALVVIEAVGYAADFYNDGSVGFGLVLLFCGGGALLVTLIGLLIYAGRAAFGRRWRSAVSRLMGSVAAVLSVYALASLGFPPWRIAFEIARPYYLYRVWVATPDASGHRRITFTQFDKEMWSGHAKREFVYSDDGAPMPEELRTSIDGDCVWTSYVKLGLQFYARQTDTAYSDPCVSGP